VLYRYQWFCHFDDDDVYVNIKQLSNLLQKYDYNKPYYIGRWPQEMRHMQQFVQVILLQAHGSYYCLFILSSLIQHS